MMSSMTGIFFIILYVTVFVLESSSSKILCIFPNPSVSHQYVFRPYTEELAKRGHELVIFTTDPYLPQNRTADNVTEIDLGFSYEYMKQTMAHSANLKRGAIMDDEVSLEANFLVNWLKIYINQLNNKEVIKYLEEYQPIDLIVVESIAELYLILTQMFKVPVICFSSFYGTPSNFEAMGAISQHPRLYPNVLRSNFDYSTFWKNLKNFYYEWKLMKSRMEAEQETNKILKAEYGPNTPTIHELRDNIDLLFVNTYPLFDYNRAVPPGVVYLGALHLKKSVGLPQDLKTYLDNSKHGVVYVSLGTNVQADKMDKELLDVFVKALGSIPYDVLWKFDANLLEKKIDNVEIRKWFPQRDLLLHPNIKLFVTQGGLQSTDETIDAGVPIVCIPFLGDQFLNCHRSAELGIGVQVDPRIMTEDDLTKAIVTVVKNESFKQNIQYLRTIIRDQPQTPLERAIWWTEYVLRHGGARHLRSPAANMTWSKYLMLDVIIPIVIITIIILILSLILITKSIYKLKSIIRSNYIKKKKT